MDEDEDDVDPDYNNENEDNSSDDDDDESYSGIEPKDLTAVDGSDVDEEEALEFEDEFENQKDVQNFARQFIENNQIPYTA